MQLVYQLLHFEPRDVAHHDVIEINQQLKSNGGLLG